MYTIYNIIARINCFVLPFLFLFFSTTFSQHFTQHRHHTITSPSNVEPLAALPSMSKQNLSGVHPALCQVSISENPRCQNFEVNCSRIKFFSKRSVSSYFIRRWSISRYFYLHHSEDNSEETFYFQLRYICDCFVKPLQSFLCFNLI